MPTVGRFNGTNLKVFLDLDGGTNTALDYVEVGCSTSATFNFEVEMIDAFCKDDGRDYDAVPGRKNGTIDLEGLILYDNAINVEELFTAADNGTRIKIKITTNVTGDPVHESDAYLTSFSFTGAVDEVATYSASFQCVGTITQATVS